MASPTKRKSGAVRSVADQPMRQTRSMAKIAAPTESATEVWSSKAPSRVSRGATESSERHEDLELSDGLSDAEADPRKKALQNSMSGRWPTDDRDRGCGAYSGFSGERVPRSPQKPALASQAPRYDFNTNSPRVLQLQQPKMESPRKGRVDDFEFELDYSLAGVEPSRENHAAKSSQDAAGPLNFGLPRSRASRTLGAPAGAPQSDTQNPRLDARHSPTKPAVTTRPVSPSKPLTRPNPFKLQAGPRTSSLQPSQAELSKRPHSTMSPSTSNESIKAAGDRRSTHEAARSHVFKSARATRPPGIDERKRADRSEQRLEVRDDLLRQGISQTFSAAPSRLSPTKESPAAPELFNRSPSRRPIDLAKLKPSPGKARRGMFLHETELEEGRSEEGASKTTGTAAQDEEDDYVLKPGPLSVSSSRRRLGGRPSDSSTDSTGRSADSSATIMPSASNIDVKQTLSSETSNALASLEASLAKLSAHSHRRTASTIPKVEEDVKASPPKRTLGDNRPRILSPSKIQNAPPGQAPRTGEAAASTQHRRDTDDDGVFKKPSSFLTKSRTLARARSEQSGSETDTSQNLDRHRSRNSSDVEQADSFSLPASATERAMVQKASSEDAVQAEAKRKAELKAARRRSMHSILSFGGGANTSLSALKREPSSSGSALTDSSFTSGADADDPKAIEESRKAAKAARRRSLYTYVPTKREDADVGDRSVGNMSSGLIIGGAGGGDGDLSIGGRSDRAKSRFLRGLTVLVDVRDQDGEDASACWVDMLKNAGAKVLVRFGERQLTHIVYKSGRPSTLHSYRSLPDPKPLVVGISWVVKCLEEGRRVDEEPFIVEVGKQAIFQKRRRSSMAPRQAPPTSTSAPRNPQKTAAEQEQELALARSKALAYAPVIPSPLRWRCYQAPVPESDRPHKARMEGDSASTPSSLDDEYEEGIGSIDGLERYSKTVNTVLKRGRFVTASA